LPMWAVAPKMATCSVCGGAGVCCAFNETPKKMVMIKNIFFMVYGL